MVTVQLPPPVIPAPPVAAVRPQAVIVPKRTAHGIHLTMTILTMGLWAPIWIIAAVLNAGKTKTKWVQQ